MLLNKYEIERLLKLPKDLIIDPQSMGRSLSVTFAPFVSQNDEIIDFVQKLRDTLIADSVHFVDYEDSFISVSYVKMLLRIVKIIMNNVLYVWSYFFNSKSEVHYIPWKVLSNSFIRKRIKKGINIVVVDPLFEDRLQIDKTESFTKNSIVTILPWPSNLAEDSEFDQHFDTAMNIFATYMTHIVILVKKDRFLIYNFNASHPIYTISEITTAVTQDLIPKLYAPIEPMKLSELVRENDFDVQDQKYKIHIGDLVRGAKKLSLASMYPPGKSVSSLPFRNKYYTWIGSLHLDHRNGMSYGFIAKQLPIKLSPVYIVEHSATANQKDLLCIAVGKEKYYLHIPDVEILTQRSGSNKTNVSPVDDLIIIGIKNGNFYYRVPIGANPKAVVRLSFDTKVILAHAIGNAAIASILRYCFGHQNTYARHAEDKGFAIIHWHGYLNDEKIPKNIYSYGGKNPHVSCSSPQSAFYAIEGKLSLLETLLDNGGNISGDVHIEPHHGSNVTYSSVEDFADFILSDSNITQLGNKYI